MRKRISLQILPRILALFLSFALALPNPAFALRPGSGMDDPNGRVRVGLEEALHRSAAGLEERSHSKGLSAAWLLRILTFTLLGTTMFSLSGDNNQQFPNREIPAQVVREHPPVAPQVPEEKRVSEKEKQLNRQQALDLIVDRLRKGEIVFLGDNHSEEAESLFFIEALLSAISSGIDFNLALEVDSELTPLANQSPAEFIKKVGEKFSERGARHLYLNELETAVTIARSGKIPIATVDAGDPRDPLRNKTIANNLRRVYEQSNRKPILVLIGKEHVSRPLISDPKKDPPAAEVLRKEYRMPGVTRILLGSVDNRSTGGPVYPSRSYDFVAQVTDPDREANLNKPVLSYEEVKKQLAPYVAGGNKSGKLLEMRLLNRETGRDELLVASVKRAEKFGLYFRIEFSDVMESLIQQRVKKDRGISPYLGRRGSIMISGEVREIYSVRSIKEFSPKSGLEEGGSLIYSDQVRPDIRHGISETDDRAVQGQYRTALDRVRALRQSMGALTSTEEYFLKFSEGQYLINVAINEQNLDLLTEGIALLESLRRSEVIDPEKYPEALLDRVGFYAQISFALHVRGVAGGDRQDLEAALRDINRALYELDRAGQPLSDSHGANREQLEQNKREIESLLAILPDVRGPTGLEEPPLTPGEAKSATAGLEEKRVAGDIIAGRFREAVREALAGTDLASVIVNGQGVILDARIGDGILSLAAALAEMGVPVVVVESELKKQPETKRLLDGIPVVSDEAAARIRLAELGIKTPIILTPAITRTPGAAFAYLQELNLLPRGLQPRAILAVGLEEGRFREQMGNYL